MGNGTAIGDRVRAHYRGLGLQSIEVPEWGLDGAPLRIHWRPVTLAERGGALEAGKKPLAFYAALIVTKALDADGNRIFNEHDRHTLQNEAVSEVVMRIGDAMFKVSEPSALGE